MYSRELKVFWHWTELPIQELQHKCNFLSDTIFLTVERSLIPSIYSHLFMQSIVSCINMHSQIKGKIKPLRNGLHSSSVISSTYQRCKGLLKPLRIGFGPFELALGFSCQLWTLQDCLRRILVTERDRHTEEELLLVAVGLILSMSVISGCDGSCVTAADILCYLMNTCCQLWTLQDCLRRFLVTERDTHTDEELLVVAVGLILLRSVISGCDGSCVTAADILCYFMNTCCWYYQLGECVNRAY